MSDIPKTFDEAFQGKEYNIVEKLKVRDGLLDLLLDHKLINNSQYETLDNKCLSGRECNRALLSDLRRADDTKVRQFFEDLVKSNQEHVVKIIIDRDLLPGEFCPGSSEAKPSVTSLKWKDRLCLLAFAYCNAALLPCELPIEHVAVLSKFYGELVDRLNAESVASRMFQCGALTMSQLVEIQSSQPEYRGAEMLLKFLLKSPRIVFDCFMKSLNETEQGFIYDQINCGDVPGESKHCELIRKHYVLLVDDIDSHVTDELYAAGVLSRKEKQDVDAELTSNRRNQKLLLILNRKSLEQWELFLTALDNSGQSYIRNMITEQTESTQ